MLKAKELPTCISNLNTALAKVEAQDFTHLEVWRENLGYECKVRSLGKYPKQISCNPVA